VFSIEKTRSTNCLDIYKRYIEQGEYGRELEIVYKSCISRYPDLADQASRQREAERQAENRRNEEEQARRSQGLFNYSFDEIQNHPKNTFQLSLIKKVIRYKYRGASNNTKVMGEITPDEACQFLGHKESVSFETKTISDYENQDFLGVYRKKTFLGRGSLEKFTFQYLNEDQKAQDAEIFTKLSCKGDLTADIKLIEIVKSLETNKSEVSWNYSDDKRSFIAKSLKFESSKSQLGSISVSK